MTSRLSVERLRREGEQFMEELSREYYSAHSGLKPTADLQPVYEAHREILGPDALAVAREYFDGSADGSEERRSARLLLDWQVESQSSRELAALDEREISCMNASPSRRRRSIDSPPPVLIAGGAP